MSGKMTAGSDINKVYKYVREMLFSGRILPGEKLPAERKIAKELDISRPRVRLALEKLELFGVLKIYPQSGSVISPYPLTAVINQISDIIDRDSFDFSSLVDVRILLESESIRLCALNHTEEDIIMLEAALEDYVENAYIHLKYEKDFAFHSAIAKACHNPVIYSLLTFITPDVLDYYYRFEVCSSDPEPVIAEHREMLALIKERKPDEAAASLQRHLATIKEFAANQKCIIPRTRI